MKNGDKTKMICPKAKEKCKPCVHRKPHLTIGTCSTNGDLLGLYPGDCHRKEYICVSYISPVKTWRDFKEEGEKIERALRFSLKTETEWRRWWAKKLFAAYQQGYEEGRKK